MPAPKAGTGPVKGNALEQRLYAALERAGASGFERQPSDIVGRPDAYFRHARPRPIAIFAQGCFYHGCRLHFRPSAEASGHRLTLEGAAMQRLTDSRIHRALTAAGTLVIPIWEHDAAHFDEHAGKIAAAVKGT